MLSSGRVRLASLEVMASAPCSYSAFSSIFKPAGHRAATHRQDAGPLSSRDRSVVESLVLPRRLMRTWCNVVVPYECSRAYSDPLWCCEDESKCGGGRGEGDASSWRQGRAMPSCASSVREGGCLDRFSISPARSRWMSDPGGLHTPSPELRSEIDAELEQIGDLPRFSDRQRYLVAHSHL